jgi:hypothetical protein
MPTRGGEIARRMLALPFVSFSMPLLLKKLLSNNKFCRKKRCSTMKMPTEFDADILGYETGFGASYPDGTPVTAPPTRVYSLVFPPIGFFPFYGIGNGDYHGFYWPIGCEEGPPIVAFSSHDVGSLIPEHSDIESLYRCQLARSSGDDENHTYCELAKQANGKLPATHDTRGVPHDDLNQLLTLDPTSPFYLCAVADVHVANNALDEAEQRYRESLDQVQEYVAAHFGLASVLRRQRRAEDATIHLRRALLGPLSFYGGSFWSDTSLPGSFRNDWHGKANGKRAVKLATIACELTNWDESVPIETLAAANAEVGNFDQAVEFQRRAMERLDDESAKKAGQARLELYQQRQPYRSKAEKRDGKRWQYSDNKTDEREPE